jgi:uncharacterized membrane protein YhfC
LNIRYFTYLINALVMIGAPIGLGVWLTRRYRLEWGLFWAGVITFVLSQVGHIPFNLILTALFKNGTLSQPLPAYQLVFNALLLGLSAGLWEEGSRFLAYRYWAKDARSWSRGLLLGAGHGGIEAVLLGVLALLGYFQLATLHGIDLAQVIGPDQLDLAHQQVQAYWTAPWYMTLLGAVERLFTLALHLSLSVMVLQVFICHQPGWLLAAVTWHALADAAGVYTLVRFGALWAEALIGGFALASLAIIFSLRRLEAPAPAVDQLPPSEPPPTITIHPMEITPENLDNTRYSN